MTIGANYKRGRLHHSPWRSDIRTSNQLNSNRIDMNPVPPREQCWGIPTYSPRPHCAYTSSSINHTTATPILCSVTLEISRYAHPSRLESTSNLHRPLPSHISCPNYYNLVS
jgi:hypothetical protein